MKTEMSLPSGSKTKGKKEEGPRKEQSLPKGSKTKGPKEDPFRMTAEPPDIKNDFPKKERREEPKHEKIPYGWTVEEGKKPDNIKTDAEGMDRAYQQGDVYGEDEKMFVAGSHTPTDWFDDLTKIPQWQYVPAGLNGIVDRRSLLHPSV